jgi:hypothetical protein
MPPRFGALAEALQRIPRLKATLGFIVNAFSAALTADTLLKREGVSPRKERVVSFVP